MIKAIFLDLDNTLWYHDKAQKKTIEKVYDYLKEIHSISDDKEAFSQVYEGCNDKVWDEYKKGKLNHEQVRVGRFVDLLSHYNINDQDLAVKLNDIYLSIYPTWSYLIDGALEVLDELKEKYPLGIITNGFPATQDIKLNNSHIRKYFQWIVYSGEVGKAKPHPEIFQYALNQVDVEASETLFIGDDFEGDIVGSKKVGMKNIWYNPKHKEDERKDQYTDYMISDLKEVCHIVKSLESC